MFVSWIENDIVEIYFRIHSRHIKRFNDIYLLSLSAKSTFKIIYLGGYISRLFNLKKILKKGDEKCMKNSTLN